MKLEGKYTVSKRDLLIVIPIMIIVLLVVLAFYSRQASLERTGPPGYAEILDRPIPFDSKIYSDIGILIKIEEIDPTVPNVTVSFFIRGWLTKNYESFRVRVYNPYSLDFEILDLNITNRGAGPFRVFYQIEDSDKGPISHTLLGYSERFPYDQYIMMYNFEIWNLDPNLVFPLEFDPGVEVYTPSGWSLKSLIKESDGSEYSFNRSVYLVLSRASNKVAYYSLSFLFMLFEYLIIGCLVFIPAKETKLSHRMMLLLTSSALVLTFYNTFTSGLLIETISYVQIFFVSVILSNMVLLAFSILAVFHWPKKIGDFNVLDFSGLVFTSLIPLILLFSYALFLRSPIFILNWGWSDSLYYRFLLWLTLYTPMVWISFRRRSGYVFFLAGFFTLIFMISDILVGSYDLFLLSVSAIQLILGLGLVCTDIKSVQAFLRQLRSKQAKDSGNATSDITKEKDDGYDHTQNDNLQKEPASESKPKTNEPEPALEKRIDKLDSFFLWVCSLSALGFAVFVGYLGLPIAPYLPIFVLIAYSVVFGYVDAAVLSNSFTKRIRGWNYLVIGLAIYTPFAATQVAKSQIESFFPTIPHIVMYLQIFIGIFLILCYFLLHRILTPRIYSNFREKLGNVTKVALQSSFLSSIFLTAILYILALVLQYSGSEFNTRMFYILFALLFLGPMIREELKSRLLLRLENYEKYVSHEQPVIHKKIPFLGFSLLLFGTIASIVFLEFSKHLPVTSSNSLIVFTFLFIVLLSPFAGLAILMTIKRTKDRFTKKREILDELSPEEVKELNEIINKLDNF